MVQRLVALRDEAEASGFTLLTYLIEVALVEAERIAEPGLVAITEADVGAQLGATKGDRAVD